MGSGFKHEQKELDIALDRLANTGTIKAEYRLLFVQTKNQTETIKQTNLFE
jgi:hypothetical protein